MPKQEDNLLKKFKVKYVLILIALAANAILLSSLLVEPWLYVAYVVLGLTAICVFLMLIDYRWQRIYKGLRPYTVSRILQILLTASLLVLFFGTFDEAQSSGSMLSYGISWAVGLFIVYEFFSFFAMAKKQKEENPDKCEFC